MLSVEEMTLVCVGEDAQPQPQSCSDFRAGIYLWGRMRRPNSMDVSGPLQAVFEPMIGESLWLWLKLDRGGRGGSRERGRPGGGGGGGESLADGLTIVLRSWQPRMSGINGVVLWRNGMAGQLPQRQQLRQLDS